MRVYIAGPVSGVLPEKLYASFSGAAERIRKAGHEAVNPLDIAAQPHSGSCPPGRLGEQGHSEACNLRADIAEIVSCDAIYLLDGWQSSWGVRLELQIATAIGLKIFLAPGAAFQLRGIDS